MVVARKPSANAMVFVHHTCNAVEPKSIESINVNPVAQVAKQESEDLMRAIIK